MTHPSSFASGDEFYHYIHRVMGLREPYCEHQGGGAWMAYDGDRPVAVYNEETGEADFDTANFYIESTYQPMKLLREMLILAEAEKPSIKKAARSVYHRDYMKTKNKPYRKYDPRKHKAQSKGE